MSAEAQLADLNTATADDRLVRECLDGNEEAWSVLVDKYKKLVFSIPVRYGLSQEDACEILQDVWLTLIAELPRLREPRTLPAWLIRVTVNKCSRLRRTRNRLLETQYDPQLGEVLSAAEPDPELMRELFREQALRDAIAEVQPRCAALVNMLFFSTPPLSYEQVAQKLEIATGSVGFIRMRCLERLRRKLEEKGFR